LIFWVVELGTDLIIFKSVSVFFGSFFTLFEGYGFRENIRNFGSFVNKNKGLVFLSMITSYFTQYMVFANI